MELFSTSTEQTEDFGRQFAKTLKEGSIIALEGDLGAGKTAFTRGIISEFGYTGRVTSPTFAIVNEYYTDHATICHFDMYRILDEDALYDIGFEDYLDGKKILIIEWSENIKSALPDNHIVVSITYGQDENSRKIIIKEAV